jgi:hypothetical protein
MLLTALHYSHQLLKETVQPGDYRRRRNDGKWQRHGFFSRISGAFR